MFLGNSGMHRLVEELVFTVHRLASVKYRNTQLIIHGMFFRFTSVKQIQKYTTDYYWHVL